MVKGKHDNPVPTVVCPFFIIKNKININGQTSLVIKTLGRELTIPIKDDIKAKAAVLQEVLGIHLSKFTLKVLDQFIQEYMHLNQSKITMVKGLTRTGWIGDTFYLPTRQHEGIAWADDRLTDAFTVKGNKEYQGKIFSYLMNTKTSIIMLSALSSVLLKKLNIPNYAVHVSGLQAGGKSASVNCAMSLYGNPRELVNTWNASKVGKELLAITYDNMPLWIDELESAGKNLSDVLNYFYDFESGKGKARGNKNLTLQAKPRFHSVLISTGEKDLDAIVLALRQERTAPLGVYRRVIEIKADDTYYDSFSGFTFTKQQKADLLMKLYAQADNHFGLLGLAWVEWIEQNLDALKLQYAEISKQDLQAGSLHNVFALLLTVLKSEWMKQYIADTGKIEAYIKELATINRDKNIQVKDIGQEFIERLQNFIHSSSGNFLQGYTAEENDRVRAKGIFGEIIYSEDPQQGKDVFILTDVFSKLCTGNGFVQKQVLEALFNMGKINKDTKTRTFTTRHTINGNRATGYRIFDVA